MINLGAEHENLDQKAYQIIKEMIMQRQLLPGDKIPQEKLAQDLGISRTPLVSALKYLEQEKLVESIPRRGFFVRLFSKEEMVYIFELREVLEGLAARRAAVSITEGQIAELKTFFRGFDADSDINDYRSYSREDRRFHNFVIEVGAKEFLKGILSATNIISFSYQVISSEGLVRSPSETMYEHIAVIEAICDRNPVAAEDLMRRHFQHSAAVLRKMIEAETRGETESSGAGNDYAVSSRKGQKDSDEISSIGRSGSMISEPVTGGDQFRPEDESGILRRAGAAGRLFIGSFQHRRLDPAMKISAVGPPIKNAMDLQNRMESRDANSSAMPGAEAPGAGCRNISLRCSVTGKKRTGAGRIRSPLNEPPYRFSKRRLL